MIRLVGRGGMLGTLVERELARLGLPYHASGRECDVTDADAIARDAPDTGPTWLVNCTAYTAVDKAETERATAFAVNDRAVGLLARYCAERGARMLHVSTDYVFDGENAAGYAEDAVTAPINAYGASKAAGEETLRATLAEHVIVRTAWLYAEHGRNFMNTVLRLLARESEPNIVDDQHGSPTYALDLARCIAKIVSSPEPAYGTYHFTNAGQTTWFGFAERIRSRAVELGILTAPPEITPIPSESYPTPAARPRHSVLLHDRITRDYGVTPRAWHDALTECLTRKKRNEEQEGLK